MMSAPAATKASLEDLLAANPLFTRLTRDAAEALRSAFDEPLLVQEREVVLCENQSFEYFAIVASGRLAAIRSGSPDRLLEVGSYFGLRTLFTDAVSPSTLVAEVPTVLHIVPRANVLKLLEARPDVATALLPAMARLMPDSLGVPRMVAAAATAASASATAPVETRRLKMRVFDYKSYQAVVMDEVNKEFNYELEYIKHKLTDETVHLAYGADAVCVFVHDKVSRSIAQSLKAHGIELVVYRCAGYDTCDVAAAAEIGLSVARVPGYSPNAIAEHATALMLALNRKLIQANTRVRSNDFTLDGLTGFNMLGKTVGVIGTGRIGACLIRIMLGFGCNVICYDLYKSPALMATPGVRYVEMDELLASSDIVSLHCLLDAKSQHLINAEAIAKMKRGVMIINTARGPLIDTQALIDGLKSGHVGSCGLDVVEGEQEYFYSNVSDKVVTNNSIAMLQAYSNNVIITAHQAYLTVEALREIAKTTFQNVQEFQNGLRGNSMTNTVFPRN